MQKLLITIQFFLSCALLYCMNTMYYSNSINATYQNYNIFSVLFALCITYIFYKAGNIYSTLSRRKWIFFVLGTLYGVFFVFGTDIMISGAVSLSSGFVWLCTILFSLFFTACTIYIYGYCAPWLCQHLQTSSFWDKLYQKCNFFHFWLFIFLCWIPILLACYPGIFSYDAIYQCAQINGSVPLNTHHPLIHTLFLGGCVHFGETVLGSPNTGLLIHSLIQMLINSAILAYACSTLKHFHIAPKLVFLCCAFYAFVPFNSLFAICATKDSLFSTLFLLLTLLLCRLVINTSTFLRSWKYPTFFVMICFLALAFRNNMLYAFCVSLPFFLIFFKKHWKRCLWIFLLPLALLKLYEGILYPALDVASGNSREAYSVIMQQYACVYNNCELDANDQDMLLELMPDEAWKKYEPHKSDVIKNEFRTEIFEAHLVDYLKLWIKLGIHNPSQYVNAFLNLTYSYWFPNDVLPDTTTYRKYIEVYTGGNITFESKFPWLLDNLIDFGMNSTYQNIPGLSMIFSPAVYLWVLLYLCTIHIYNRQYRIFIVMLMPSTFFLTMLLGPVALLRYMYPLILCTPILCVLHNRFNN